MNNTFRTIPGFPRYAINEDGELISFQHPKPIFLKPQFDPKTGYLKVRIKSSTGTRGAYIHDLVARAFIGERPQGHDIDHRDGNKLNNSVSNLHYVTRKENQMNPNNHGMNGYQAYAARKVIAIKDGIERTFDNCSELCKALGMSAPGVSQCLSGKIHTHRGYSLRWA